MSCDTFVRKLGIQETFLRQRALNKMYKHFSVSCSFNDELNTGLLFKVLRGMILEHPSLACHVANIGSDGLPELHLHNKILFKDLVKFDSSALKMDADLMRSIDLNVFFDPADASKPLFRVLVLKDKKTLVATFDHSLFDGESGSHFWKVFYDKLIEVNASEDLKDIDSLVLFDFEKDYELVKNRAYLPRSEDIYDLRPDLLHKLSKTLRSYLPEFFHPYLKDANYAPSPKGFTQWFSPTKPYREQFNDFKFEVINIPKEDLSTVTKACKSKNITVNSYIHACIMNAYVQYGDLQGLNDEKHFIRMPTAVGCRRFATKDDRRKFDVNFGNMFLLGPSAHVPSAELKTFSWDAAKKIDATNKIALDDRRMAMNLGSPLVGVTSLEEMNQVCLSPLKHFRPDTIRNSNLGFMKFSNEAAPSSSWEVEDMAFVQDTNMGSNIILNTVSTKNGGMNISFSYIEDGSVGNMRLVIEHFKENIVKFAAAV